MLFALNDPPCIAIALDAIARPSPCPFDRRSHLTRLGPQFAQELKAIEARHHDVEQEVGDQQNAALGAAQQ